MYRSTWEPHGLITAPIMEALYLSAKCGVDDEGNLVVEPSEYKPEKFFAYLFNKVYFSSMDFSVSSERPCHSFSQTSCDLLVENVEGHTPPLFCFAGLDSQTDNLAAAAEEQATIYCRDYLATIAEVDEVFACTLIGASLRFWRYSQSEAKLKGFWDVFEYGEFGCYLDVGEEDNRERLERAFAVITNWPTMPMES